jgi:hypothetical protein
VSLKSELRGHLLDDNAIATAVGTRIYPSRRPKAAGLPNIVLTRISTVVADQLVGITGHERARVQIDVRATTDEAAEALARLCQARLAAVSQRRLGDDGLGIWVDGIAIDGGLRDDAEHRDDGSDDWQYLRSFDAMVDFQTG